MESIIDISPKKYESKSETPKKRGRKPKILSTNNFDNEISDENDVSAKKHKSKREIKSTNIYSVKSQNKITSFFDNKPKDDDVIILHLETDADDIKTKMRMMDNTTGIMTSLNSQSVETDCNRGNDIINLNEPTPYQMYTSITKSKESGNYIPFRTREPNIESNTGAIDRTNIESNTGAIDRTNINIKEVNINEGNDSCNNDDDTSIKKYSKTMELYQKMIIKRNDDLILNDIPRNDKLDFNEEYQDTTKLKIHEKINYSPYGEDTFIKINDYERSKAGLTTLENPTTLHGIESYSSMKVMDEETDPFSIRITDNDMQHLQRESTKKQDLIDITEDHNIYNNKVREGIYITDNLNYRVKSTSLRPTCQRTVIHSVLKNILNCNDKREWPISTDIHCWWCCYGFDTPPVSLPKKYNNKTGNFYVIGNFCSFNCAEAYRIDNKKEYFTAGMLHLMYNVLHDEEIYEIKPAPPRTALDIFGGPLSIEDFRNASLRMHKYSIVNPPLIAIVHQIEESWSEPAQTSPSIFKTNIGSSKIEQSDFVIKETEDKLHLRLKRSKPLSNSRKTLDNLLGITTIKKSN